MSAGSWPVQVAVYDALKAAGTAEGRIYDEPPQSDDSVFPYVLIGESQVIPADVQCREAAEEFIDLHIWSRYRGWREVKEVAAAISAALHAQSLSADGRSACAVFVDSVRMVRDPDGLTRHGIQTLKIYHAD